MVCVSSFLFLSSMQENLIVLIAFDSLHHLNKHFRNIVEKIEKMQSFSRTLKEHSLQKSISRYSSISLSYLIPEMFTTHCSTLHCEIKCIVCTANSN